MKIRAKFGHQRELITIDSEDDTVYLSTLKAAIRAKFHFASDTVVNVGLNGKDVLQGDSTLAQLGIVSGDLVIVTTPSNDGIQNQPLIPQANAQSNDASTNRSMPSSSTSSSTNKSMPNASLGLSKKYKESVNMAQKDSEGGGVNLQRQDEDGLAMDVEETVTDPEVNRYLSEPMLCRDSTRDQVPQRLVLLYQDAGVQNVADALCVVLHLLMLETGYTVSSSSASSSVDDDDSMKMPSGWRSPGAYRLLYLHRNNPNVTSKIICVTLGRKMVIHGCAELPDKEDCSLQLQINIYEYIQQSTGAAHEAYKNLPKLSQVFKDKISYRLIEDSRQLMELPALSGFSGLFSELKFAVLKYLDFRSLVRMSATCSELKTMARGRSLWRRLYLLEFGRRGDESLHQDWLQYFEESYIRRKEREEMIHRPVFIPGPQPYPQGCFRPPLPYAPGAPTGIIGGDYDIDPFGFHGHMVPRPLGPFRPPRPGFPGLPGNSRPSRGTGGLGGFGPRPPFF
ncbi:F-box only protein 7-like [Lineus longissimus]|uniref:F-box only protein 7-like n=1 Tax=Lineus longissimus TaxID=88925 RepID=UPI002B4E4B5A